MNEERTTESAPDKTSGAPLVAVVEIGTTAIRMVIAQIGEDGSYRTLDSLRQTVSLGRDTFTKGRIEQETTEECVRVLRSFVQVLKEYRITDGRQITAIATSAVREADNREAFLDRLYIGTGLTVETIDDAEVKRYTYLAVHPLLDSIPALKDADTLVIEVGGGNTEVLVFHHGEIGNALTFRVGSLRLRRMLEEQRAPVVRLAEIMQSHVDRRVEQIRQRTVGDHAPHMLALGGDTRFACSVLLPDWDWEKQAAARLPVPALAHLTHSILQLSADDLVRRYHVTYPEAETLGPALLVYTRLAQSLKLRQILVGRSSLRDGVLSEVATHGPWTEEFKRQVEGSALEIGRKYGFDEEHADRVAQYSGELFHVLHDEHLLHPRYELILTIASLLHEVGMFVSNRSHHKHSMYLIQNSDIFGLGARDILLAALVARYHRRAMPKASHEEYCSLDRDGRIAVQKMAAMLRVADALDRGRRPRRRKYRFALDNGRLAITTGRVRDLTLEQHGLQEKGNMFEQVYGLTIALRSSAPGGRDGDS